MGVSLEGTEPSEFSGKPKLNISVMTFNTKNTHVFDFVSDGKTSMMKVKMLISTRTLAKGKMAEKHPKLK